MFNREIFKESNTCARVSEVLLESKPRPGQVHKLKSIFEVCVCVCVCVSQCVYVCVSGVFHKVSGVSLIFSDFLRTCLYWPAL